MSVETLARQRAGQLGGQEIRLNTEISDSFEYVRAVELAPLFPNAYQYDALSGTLIFYRFDGVTVGMKAGDNRVVVGSKVFYTGFQTIRRDSRILIPFSNVQTYLFPQVRLEPVDGLESNGLDNPTFQNPVIGGNQSSPFQYSNQGKVDLSQPTPTAVPLPPDLGVNSPGLTFSNDGSLAPSSVIVLDPGGNREGSNWVSSLTVNEPDLTLSICEKLSRLLQDTPNFEIVLTRTRTQPANMTQEQRIGVANAHHGTIYISIQSGLMANAGTSRAVIYFQNEPDQQPSARVIPASSLMTQTTWNNTYRMHLKDSFRLSQLLMQELKPFYALRGIIKIDENPRPGRLQALQGLTMPGVLIELGNLQHPATARHFASDRIQMELAETLERAISNYLYERSGMARTVGVR